MKLSLFDTHCDTAFELYRRKEELRENTCHIALTKAQEYDKYVQLFAVWSDRRYDDQTCWEDFLKIADHFDALIAQEATSIARVTSKSELDRALAEKGRAAVLAVEDARLLAEDIDRLQVLYDKGVRCMTLLWGGDTCIGGSHNTENGLTDFGKLVVKRCFELGIVPDISHASEKSVDDVIEIANQYNKPFIATHSNSYSAYAHTRNLRDRHLSELMRLGGTVGISMCPSHLRDCAKQAATSDDVVRHIDRYMELGACHSLCFGCDFDGTDLPADISNVGDLYKVADKLVLHGYTTEQIENIFWKNAYRFFQTQLS